ncbi:MAG: RNA polymerase sigma-70 factor [Arachidicoccus sp.]|nr:RNA polymerase sigma-70 factor [Arachidicoccus sp.]
MDSYAILSDAELLSLLKEDDALAFEAIYSKYWRTLYLSSFSVLRDEDACSDIIQELFIWLWTYKATVKIDNLKAYLSAAVKFKVANYIKANKTHDRLYIYYAASSSEKYANSVEDEMELRELKIMVEQAVKRLPAKCRKIYHLSRNEGFSNKQISAQLNLSVKTVENQLTIALRRIRNALKSFFILLSIILVSIFIGK